MNLRKRWHRNLERIRTEPGLKKNVLVIGGLIVLALIAGSIILGNQRFNAPWADKYQLSAQFEAVPGIAPGNGQEVRMNGVIVGQITGARVDDTGHAVLEMALEPEYSVREDAILVLRPKSPLNEMYLTIDPGSPDAATLPSGSTLPVSNTRRPVQVDEVLGHLDDRARTALTSLLAEADDALATAPENLPAGLDATSDFAIQVQPVASLLDQRRRAIASLVSSLSQITAAVGENDKRLYALAGALDSTLAVVADESGSLDAALSELPGLTDELTSSTRSVQALAAELDPTLAGVRESTEVLPGALRDLTSTAQRLRETVEVARPVVADARPVVADMRPYSGALARSLPVLERSTARLDPVTSILTKYLPDLGAFMVNTRSLTSMRDGNGGILRGMLEVTSTTLPTDLLADLSPDDVEGPLG